MFDFLVNLTLVLLALGAICVAALVFMAMRRQWRAEAEVPPLGDKITVPTPHGEGALHYVAKGEARPDRRPIVLIHGAGGTLRHFSATILDALGETDLAIAVDRPGSGYSEPGSLERMSLADQADFIRRGLDVLGIEKPVLVGHSFGGSIALAYALEHPDDVSALVLLAPGAYPFSPPPPAKAQTVDNAFMRRALAWTILPREIEKLRPAVLAATFGPQTPPEDFQTEAGGALTLRPTQLHAFLTEQSVYQAGLRAQSTRYAELALPITILFGAEDHIITADQHATPLAKAAPNVSSTVYDRIGHMLPFAIPDDVVDAVRAAAAQPAKTSA